MNLRCLLHTTAVLLQSLEADTTVKHLLLLLLCHKPMSENAINFAEGVKVPQDPNEINPAVELASIFFFFN